MGLCHDQGEAPSTAALFPPEPPHGAELDVDLAPGPFPELSGVHHSFPSAFQNLLP